MERKNMLVGFANTLAGGIPGRKRVNWNNTNVSFHQISNPCCSFTPKQNIAI